MSLAARNRGTRIGLMGARDLRVACGITQATIAAALGVSQVSVHYWETGMAVPAGARGAAYVRVMKGLSRHLEIEES